MMLQNYQYQVKKTSSYKFSIYILILYFILAPMEDLLSGSYGTISRYLGLFLLIFGFVEYGLKLRFINKKGDIAILWLIFLCVFSCVWAIDLGVAFNRNISYILLPGLYIFIGMIEFSKKDVIAIEYSIIISGIITVVYLLVNGKLNLVNVTRLELVDKNDPNNFAALLLLPFGVGIKYFILSKKKIKKWFLFLLSIILLFIIFLTGSRGGLVSVGVFLSILLFQRKNNKRFSLLFYITIFILIFWFLIPFLPEFIRWRLFSVESYISQKETIGSRSDIWRTILQEVMPNMPVWGYGSGCAPIILQDYYGYRKGVHNTYLNMILEYGILGIPVFLWFLWKKLRIQIKQRNVINIGLLLGICTTILFLDSYAKKYFWNILFFLEINNIGFANEDNRNITSVSSV